MAEELLHAERRGPRKPQEGRRRVVAQIMHGPGVSHACGSQRLVGGILEAARGDRPKTPPTLPKPEARQACFERSPPPSCKLPRLLRRQRQHMRQAVLALAKRDDPRLGIEGGGGKEGFAQADAEGGNEVEDGAVMHRECGPPRVKFGHREIARASLRLRETQAPPIDRRTRYLEYGPAIPQNWA